MRRLSHAQVVMRFANRLNTASLRSESGSASVEFVLLAIPIFLPILIFVNQFSELSHAELLAKTMARESLRAFVTSPSAMAAGGRAKATINELAKASGLNSDEIGAIKLEFKCSKFPCLSPEGRVRSIVRFNLRNQGREVMAEAEEAISPWQWNGLGVLGIPDFGIDLK